MEKIAYNVQEAAAAHRPDFPAVRVGNRILIPCESLARWLEAQEGKQL